MPKIIMRGRPVCGGIAQGPALVCSNSIQGWAGVDDRTGKIIERGHEHLGQTIKGTILVVPGSRGSNGWSCHFHATKIRHNDPSGWIIKQIDSHIGVTLVVMGAPAVADLEEDPFSLIRTGDWVKIDGDTGIVEITPAEPEA